MGTRKLQSVRPSKRVFAFVFLSLAMLSGCSSDLHLKELNAFLEQPLCEVSVVEHLCCLLFLAMLTK